MAQVDVILAVDRLLQTETVTAGAAGTAITLTPRKIITVFADGKCYLKFSRAGTAAAATDILFPGAGDRTFRTAKWTKLSIFAAAGGNVITSVVEMSTL